MISAIRTSSKKNSLQLDFHNHNVPINECETISKIKDVVESSGMCTARYKDFTLQISPSQNKYFESKSLQMMKEKKSCILRLAIVLDNCKAAKRLQAEDTIISLKYGRGWNWVHEFGINVDGDYKITVPVSPFIS